MDLFRYNSPDTFLGGQAINGYDSVAWTERYQEPGDFEIVARVSTGLKDFLPEGTLISHTKTLDIMMVENHEIKEEPDVDPIVTITGRSLVAILEHRIAGQNRNWASPPASLEVSQYVIGANFSWNQAVVLVRDHVDTGFVDTASDGIPNLNVSQSVSFVTGPSEARTLARGDILRHLIELLAVDNLGCRVIRRHNFSGLPSPGSESQLLIHNAWDKRNSVIFSPRNGDIDAADYLWSIKSMKNAALVTGKFVEAMVPGSSTGRDKRVMLVDGSDIDGHLEAIPTGSALTAIRATMTTRGTQAIAKQKRLALTRVDISSTPTYEYRRDYDIGDLVSVDSNYSTGHDTMRVVEHVEIVDENGESAQPTLEIIT